MPLQGWAHTFYWEFSDTLVTPVLVSRGGYPAWQASVIAPSLFGVIGAWIDHHLGWLRWWWRLDRRIARLPLPRRQVLVQTLELLDSPAYGAARTAVRETAQTLGFTRPEAWVAYSRAIKAHPGRAENLFRHVRACELTEQHLGSTLTHPVVNFVTELAYQEYAIRPWRS